MHNFPSVNTVFFLIIYMMSDICFYIDGNFRKSKDSGMDFYCPFNSVLTSTSLLVRYILTKNCLGIKPPVFVIVTAEYLLDDVQDQNIVVEGLKVCCI